MKQFIPPEFVKRYLPGTMLAGIIVVAVFMRFYRIVDLPPALHPNEAAYGNAALELLLNKKISFGSSVGGFSTVFVALEALALTFMKTSVWALRVVPAILSVLTVLFTYLVARSWYGRRVGLIAAGVLAVNPWAITVGRDALAAGAAPFFVVLSLWLATKAYRSRSWAWSGLLALSLALATYNYIGTALLIPALGLVLVITLIFARRRLPSIAKLGVAVAILVFLLAPSIYLAVKNSNTVTNNITSSTILSRSNNVDKLKLVGSNALDTFLMFNLKGDENYRHNLGGLPLLNTFIGIMFLLGLLFVFTRPKRLTNLTVIISFVALLLPAILTSGDVPNALRSAGALPLIMILVGVGVNYLLRRWYATFPVNNIARSVGLVLVLILLTLTAFQGYKQYFVAWAQDPKTYTSYDEPLTEMAKFLNAESGARGLSAENTYVVVSEYENQTIQFLTHKRTEYSLIGDDALRALPLNKKPKLFILGSDASAKEKLDIITVKYPGGRIVNHYSPLNQQQIFYSYELNK
ncbi:glycosyltransferase family 39 protein [bacterium]|nr:glycosyltransferase family 39 protein [bacterium]